MPWTPNHYPPSMLRLSPPVRVKAIAIANALLEDGNDEAEAIRIAIARAKLWAEGRSMRLFASGASSSGLRPD
jgi:uncharacterized protein YdaT